MLLELRIVKELISFESNKVMKIIPFMCLTSVRLINGSFFMILVLKNS